MASDAELKEFLVRMSNGGRAAAAAVKSNSNSNKSKCDSEVAVSCDSKNGSSNNADNNNDLLASGTWSGSLRGRRGRRRRRSWPPTSEAAASTSEAAASGIFVNDDDDCDGDGDVALASYGCPMCNNNNASSRKDDATFISPEAEVACEGSLGDVVVGGYGLGVIGRMMAAQQQVSIKSV